MNDASTPSFRNQPVRPSDIPDYRDAGFEPVASTFRRYTLLSTVVSCMPFAIVPVALRLVRDVPMTGVLAVAGGLLGITTLIALYRWIDAGYRGWALREHDIIARYGVLWRSVITLPVARIQHVETTSGPLERSQGLARLKLFTAGGMTADLTVIGLSDHTAGRLREYLVEQIRLRDAAGSAEAAEAPDVTSAEAGPEPHARND
jgi:hypothetical protein